MSKRGFGAGRSLLFLNAALLASAIAAPAFAQIETVVVTAQKRSEDIQTVPIAITAFSAQDLAARQIYQFKDLQFSTPSVTYSKGNFTSSDFSIRGIGQSVVSGDEESGVATDVNDVYLLSPLLSESTFYDLQRVEVLRGPQSTLYGRGATGGVVNLITQPPDLSSGYGDIYASYGNYNAIEVRGDVNAPIIDDQLAFRLAGDWQKHDGFIDNTFNNSHIDSQDTYSVRPSLRWEPSNRTTVDFVAQFTREDDSHMRSTRQLCMTDPTAILGCLPNGLANEPVNALSTAAFIEGTRQALGNLGYALTGNPALIPVFAQMGLFDLEHPPGLPPGFNEPSNPFSVYSDFNPIYRAQDSFMNLTVKQNVVNWLDATLVVGYDHPSNFSQESYNNVPGLTLDTPKGIQTLETAVGTFAALLPAFGESFAPYEQYFANIANGELPLSQIKQLGLVSGNYNFTKDLTAYDQSDFGESQWSGELRFNTKFSGPLNFMLAGYSLHAHSITDYYVASPMLDYPSILLGAFLGPFFNPLQCGAAAGAACVDAPPFYHNYGEESLQSNAIFGEAYYDAIPDTLRFTAGLRYTEDTKSEANRITFESVPAPIGSTNIDGSIDAANTVSEALGNGCIYDADPTKAGCQNIQYSDATWRKVTGRFVADWTPKLDFTDSTLVYASYARGYKAGGFNPGIQFGLNVPVAYGPEQVDAFELGSKNMVLNNTLQANGDVWYYDYKDYQVSSILGNTSVNENINDAHLWGLEGEFIWAPTDQWQFGLNLSHENSSIGNQMLLDTRNPTGGRSDVVLIKDSNISAAAGQNCVLYFTPTSLNPNELTPGQLGLPGFLVPPGGAHALAASGIANANFGFCPVDVPASELPALAAYGWSFTDPKGIGDANGSPVNIGGNELENTPDFQVNISGQYTQPLDNGFTLVGRVDFYWQSHMWGRVWQDPADRIGSWNTMNALLTLNSPDGKWYVQGFVKNIFDNSNITGLYLTSSSSGLYTNAFQEDPRTYGIAFGAHL
ncbi:MAG TPA: TonB-dependent receptor [Rhizomicrobium sp.]|nr:TonB-dependent receptor [Rhizomicrobium sp.]